MGSKKKKLKKEKHHHIHKKNKDIKSRNKKIKLKKKTERQNKKEVDGGFNVPIPKEFASSSSSADKSMAPMTKEEWDKRQSIVRKVYDESTGRYRLIKGDGEVLEEIVSLVRHKEINKEATKEDGEYFEQRVRNKK